MWTCSRGAANSIRVCGERLVNSQMLSVWNWYFKEKYIRNDGCTFKYANAKQTTFWHSFEFASAPHALFAFAYKCGHNFEYTDLFVAVRSVLTTCFYNGHLLPAARSRIIRAENRNMTTSIYQHASWMYPNLPNSVLWNKATWRI